MLSTTFSYDQLARMTGTTDMLGRQVRYDIDNLNRRSALFEGDLIFTTYAYDDAGRLAAARLTDKTGPLWDYVAEVSFGRDGLGRVDLVSRLATGGGGVPQANGQSLLGYDAMGRVTAVTHNAAGGGALATYSYSYDLAGRLTNETYKGALKTYAYDAKNQITTDNTATHSYDAAGNRTDTGYTVTTGNRLTSDGLWSYSYDGEGNVTQRVSGSSPDKWNYYYDHRNRLVKIEKLGAGDQLVWSQINVYDGIDRLMEKRVDANGSQPGGETRTRYLYDGDQIFREDEAPPPVSGPHVYSVKARYLWALDQVFARMDPNGNVTWALNDRQGTVKDVADANSILNTRTFDSFGKLTNQTSPGVDFIFAYNGWLRHPTANLYVQAGSAYDPHTGRWFSQAEAGENPYPLAGNQPNFLASPDWAGDAQLAAAAMGEFNAEQLERWKPAPKVHSEFDWLGNLIRPGQFFERWDVLGEIATAAVTAAADAVDELDSFVAGAADALTFGLTTRFREWAYGERATRNHQGPAFMLGQLVGTGLSIGLGFGGNPCALPTLARLGYRAIQAAEVVGASWNAIEHYQKGEYLKGTLNVVGAAFGANNLFKACFTHEALVDLTTGRTPIIKVREGDIVEAKAEWDPTGPIVHARVEAVMTTVARIWHLHVRGSVLRTTAEHPFYAFGKEWTPTASLQPGDWIWTKQHGWVEVEDVCDSGVEETVYNLRVADYHTYFVSVAEWEFSLWVHNAYVIHGNSLDSPKVTVLYKLVTKSGEFLKWGITSLANPLRRYTKEFLKDKDLIKVFASTRRHAAAVEKVLEKQVPGLLNKVRWAGVHLLR